MNFQDPERLWLGVGMLAVVVAYIALQARRGRFAARYASPGMLAKLAPRRPGWRRHLSAVAFAFVLGLLITAFARPGADAKVPRDRATIIIAVDTSGSMVASDIKPNRIEVAKKAAAEFVDHLPARFNVGLVSFNQGASVVVPPSTDHAALKAGLDGLHTRPLTAIGEAVFTSLAAIANLDPQAADDPPPAHIVLLSDGGNTTGRPVEDAAQAALDAHVPVSTIAYGTPNGRLRNNLAVPVDTGLLRRLAESTKGTFYEAASGNELQKVYSDVGTSIGFRNQRKDMSVWFVGLALIAALAVAVPSLIWFARLA
ncbi:MAG TPA: VWA domain-containing protein [Actinomycetota bacterium]|nr:VWA domain-containing protein [Actinomycetota bacterium]